MNTNQIANKLKEMLQNGHFEMAQKEFFAEEAISIEPIESGIPPTKGLQAILQKGQNFRDSVEQFHSLEVSSPISTFNYISIALKVELTFKGQSKTTMEEIIVYKIENGKIVEEQFFY